MQGRIVQLWRGRRAQAAPEGSAASSAGSAGPGEERVPSTDALALPEPHGEAAPLPEQPVLLLPSGGARPVHVGELLPPARRRWPVAALQLPAIPKRAILAAGVCAGLAAPGLARHLATRLLFGRPAVRGEGVLEITRVVYTGPLTPRAASAIGKALAAARR